jgi:hypothetical protein
MRCIFKSIVLKTKTNASESNQFIAEHMEKEGSSALRITTIPPNIHPKAINNMLKG